MHPTSLPPAVALAALAGYVHDARTDARRLRTCRAVLAGELARRGLPVEDPELLAAVPAAGPHAEAPEGGLAAVAAELLAEEDPEVRVRLTPARLFAWLPPTPMRLHGRSWLWRAPAEFVLAQLPPLARAGLGTTRIVWRGPERLRFTSSNAWAGLGADQCAAPGSEHDLDCSGPVAIDLQRGPAAPAALRLSVVARPHLRVGRGPMLVVEPLPLLELQVRTGQGAPVLAAFLVPMGGE